MNGRHTRTGCERDINDYYYFVMTTSSGTNANVHLFSEEWAPQNAAVNASANYSHCPNAPTQSKYRAHTQASWHGRAIASTVLKRVYDGTERDACVRACRTNTAYTASMHSIDTKSQSWRQSSGSFFIRIAISLLLGKRRFGWLIMVTRFSRFPAVKRKC